MEPLNSVLTPKRVRNKQNHQKGSGEAGPKINPRLATINLFLKHTVSERAPVRPYYFTAAEMSLICSKGSMSKNGQKSTAETSPVSEKVNKVVQRLGKMPKLHFKALIFMSLFYRAFVIRFLLRPENWILLTTRPSDGKGKMAEGADTALNNETVTIKLFEDLSFQILFLFLVGYLNEFQAENQAQNIDPNTKSNWYSVPSTKKPENNPSSQVQAKLEKMLEKGVMGEKVDSKRFQSMKDLVGKDADVEFGQCSKYLDQLLRVLRKGVSY